VVDDGSSVDGMPMAIVSLQGRWVAGVEVCGWFGEEETEEERRAKFMMPSAAPLLQAGSHAGLPRASALVDDCPGLFLT
jgi:hypothetical protein